MVRVTLKYFVYTFAILLSLSLYLEYANASGLLVSSENATATTPAKPTTTKTSTTRHTSAAVREVAYYSAISSALIAGIVCRYSL
ncbi:unnamed protein product [Heterobilharzia americana]|nr:unnamed protein product [Heterobilharzia americana]